MVKTLPANAGDTVLIPGSGRAPSLGEGNGYPLQYSCLGNPMDRGAWQATVHGVARVRHNCNPKFLIYPSPTPLSSVFHFPVCADRLLLDQNPSKIRMTSSTKRNGFLQDLSPPNCDYSGRLSLTQKKET